MIRLLGNHVAVLLVIFYGVVFLCSCYIHVSLFCYVISCYVLSFHVTCHVMSCQVMSHVMLCHLIILVTSIRTYMIYQVHGLNFVVKQGKGFPA